MKVFIFIIFIGITSPTLAQSYYQKTFGDTSSYAEEAMGIAESPDSGFLFYGWCPTADSLIGTLGILKIDSTGSEVFRKYFRLASGSFQTGFAHDFIKSNTNQYYGGGEVMTNTITEATSAVLVKFNEVGDTVFTKEYKMNWRSWILDIKQIHDGNLICTGYFNDTVGIDNGDMFVMKLDTSGNILWEQNFGVPDSQEYGYSIYEMANHNLIISGIWDEDVTMPLSNDPWKAFLMCIDSLGNQKWIQYYNPYYQNSFIDAEPANDGGFILCGGTFYSFGSANYHGYLVKTDSLGNTQWSSFYQLASNQPTEFRTVHQNIDGSFIICGFARDSINTLCGLLIKFDLAGNFIWEQHYPNLLSTYLMDIKILADGGYITCGTTNIGGVGYGPVQYLVIKTDSLGCYQNCWTGMGEINLGVKEDGITVHPNPSDGVFIFENNTFSEIEKTEVFNSIGDKIIEQEGMIKEINLGDKQEGIYLYRITFHGGKIIQGKLLKL